MTGYALAWRCAQAQCKRMHAAFSKMVAEWGMHAVFALQPQGKKRKPENATDGGSTDSMDGLHLLKWLACLTFGNLSISAFQTVQAYKQVALERIG
ncbi:hypothetical protein HaLaN_24390 [Haematococcus lacustris]|uniref:Uncharacterized protein n=1 Tax=Haematococcus lacustris TaxID=44745 RepID=A0A699ZTQ7_HAELA|nr:hypothetical protein HaLaN_24390 [Haematococcus lacustris]